MSTFKDYLTESTKSYDYKIKIAGEPKDIDKNALETALQKFDLASMSAGKSTPIMTLPLDFPRLSNESVTIFDVTTNYHQELQEYVTFYVFQQLTSWLENQVSQQKNIRTIWKLQEI